MRVPFGTKTMSDAACIIILIDLTRDFDESRAEVEQIQESIMNKCNEDILVVVIGTNANATEERKAPPQAALEELFSDDYKMEYRAELNTNAKNKVQSQMDILINEIIRKVKAGKMLHYTVDVQLKVQTPKGVAPDRRLSSHGAVKLNKEFHSKDHKEENKQKKKKKCC